jgi:hypothetical protein
MNRRNQTDYEFPDAWGLYTDRQKHEWFVRERTFRRAIAQDTVFGRAYRQAEAESERLMGLIPTQMVGHDHDQDVARAV